ncbi:MAG: MFS transporter [Acutalibacteraceae bacterium]
MKTVTKKTIVNFCLPQFAVGLFTTMLNNYLIYFYQPSTASGLPTLITQGYVFLGVLTVIGFIKAAGHVIDAVTDPVVAGISDKCKSKNGRRIPFMKWFAVPFGVSALMIFCAPASAPGALNNIWIALWIWAYYCFYTLYMIPHNALLPEMISDAGKRVDAYTMSSLFFVTGSMLGYATPAIVSVIKSFGVSPLGAWRATFAFFTVIGIVLLLVPAFTIKEKEYVNSVLPQVSLATSLKHAFSNRHFVILTFAQLFENTGMAFFQACIMYYITSLMKIPESQSIIIMATSIVGSLILYPLVNKWAKNKGKKTPIIIGCVVFTAAEFIICLCDLIPGNSMVIAIVFALVVSFPFAVLNILPGSMMSDVIQYDTVMTGVNQEGVFGAARSFISKMGTSIATMIVPSLIVIGAATGENIGKKGLMLTAVVGGCFCLAAVIMFCFYREKEILSTIKEAKKNPADQTK